MDSFEEDSFSRMSSWEAVSKTIDPFENVEERISSLNPLEKIGTGESPENKRRVDSRILNYRMMGYF